MLDVAEAGGKGASLGEMMRNGIPVPSGFVISASAFREFLQTAGLEPMIASILQETDPRQPIALEDASRRIRTAMGNMDIPAPLRNEILAGYKRLDAARVAIRSSATAEDGASAAWAGQLETYLHTDEAHLLENIKKCWTSLYTPRAIFYRLQNGLREDAIAVAVVLQRMIESDVSGVAFSVHPVTQNPNHILIEAGFGLGEAIVSGSISPDSYTVRKDDADMESIRIQEQTRGLFATGDGYGWKDIPAGEGKQQKLPSADIVRLAGIVERIERHFGFPVDVEWAKEGDDFFITQSRPITTLRATGAEAPQPETDPFVVRGKTWTLGVTRNMSFWHQCLLLQGWHNDLPAFGIPFRLELLSVTVEGTHSHCLFHDPHYAAFLETITPIFRDRQALRELQNRYLLHAENLLGALALCAAALNPESLEGFFTSYQRFTAGLQITTGYGKRGTDILQETLRRHGLPEKDLARVISVITYPAEHTPLFASQRDLLEIAAEIQSDGLSSEGKNVRLQAWLERYANIPVNYCDEPWTLADAEEQLASLLRKNCRSELEMLTESHARRLRDREQTLSDLDDDLIRRLADGLAVCTSLNEYRKNIFSTVSLRYRPVFTRIAKRAGSDEWRDCFYLMPSEMLAVVRGEDVHLPALKLQRSVAGLLCDAAGMAQLLEKRDAQRIADCVGTLHGESPLRPSDDARITGFSANGGKARGIAKIVLSSKEFGKFQTGDILVTTMTSVDFVPLMEKAAAFVTNEGGITCHASIVAREMNKPCIIATKTATRILQDGDLIEVDADAGEVRILRP